METNSNTPTQKKTVSVEILHLDEIGYGPQGQLTRREWRKECLSMLCGGRGHFEAWQDMNRIQSKSNLLGVSFAAKVILEDGSQFEVWTCPVSTDSLKILDL